MEYFIGLYLLFISTTQYFIEHNFKGLVLFLLLGSLVGLMSSFLLAFFGRLFYKPFRLNLAQKIVSGLIAFLVMLSAPIYIAAEYLAPTILASVDQWRDSLANDNLWIQQQFAHQYQEIKSMKIEDFTKYPAPERGGNAIPMRHVESQVKVSQMTAEAAIENFNKSNPLISIVIRTNSKIPADVVNNDVTKFFKTNPGSPYLQPRGIQLAADQIYKELTPQIPRIIFVVRVFLIILISLLYVILLSWVAFSALRQIRVYSAHSV